MTAVTNRQVKIRVASVRDAGAVADLCGRTLDRTDADDLPGLERLLWEDPDSPASMRLVAESESRLVGCIFGSARDYGDDRGLTGFIKLLSVDPSARRHRIGSQLLGVLERELFGLGVRSIWAGGSQPRYWWPGVDRANAAATSFLTRCGYETADEVVNMRVALPVAPSHREPPSGLIARRLTAADWASFSLWMGETWGAAWQDEVELTLRREPVSCFVALKHDDLIGFAAYDTNRRGWFGPMGTTPRSQGKGVGELLLRKCLDDVGARRATACVIAWAGPRDFYRRTVGATVDREFVRCRKDRAVVASAETRCSSQMATHEVTQEMATRSKELS